jgi:hypothetical protein
MALEESLSNRRITRSMTAGKRRITRSMTAGTAKGEEEEAPAKKKMIRLPQEDLDRILSRPRVLDLPRYIQDLKSWNPDLIPSAEEEMDEETVEFYDEARLFSDSAEAYREFQAWIRSEYDKYGYVEVEDDYLAKVEETRAWQEEFKAELAQDIDDDLLGMLFKNQF